jgi:hypothetical protein
MGLFSFWEMWFYKDASPDGLCLVFDFKRRNASASRWKSTGPWGAGRNMIFLLNKLTYYYFMIVFGRYYDL